MPRGAGAIISLVAALVVCGLDAHGLLATI
jgi:hypothetical protein